MSPRHSSLTPGERLVQQRLKELLPDEDRSRRRKLAIALLELDGKEATGESISSRKSQITKWLNGYVGVSVPSGAKLVKAFKKIGVIIPKDHLRATPEARDPMTDLEKRVEELERRLGA